MEKIGIWGDSITFGAGDSEKGGWVNRLDEDLEVEIHNLGIGGDRSYDLISRFEVECEKMEPDIILFAIGTNDSQFSGSHDNSSTSLEKFRENLKWLIDTARKYSKQIGFVGLTKVDDSKVMPSGEDTGYDNENIVMYDAVVEDVCEINGLPYLYMFNSLDEGDLEDGLHPNSMGHEKMFLKIKEFVKENFE